MNDIEVLEKLMMIYQELKKDYEKGHLSAYEMQFEDFKAIENLLKERQSDKERIKELEESEKYIYEAYQDAGKKMFEYAEELENSIPTSLIKEKIEEYINSILENLDEDRRWCDMELVDNFRKLEKELLNKNVK